MALRGNEDKRAVWKLIQCPHMVTDRRLLVIYKSEGDLNQFLSLKKLIQENVFGSEVC